MVWEIPKFPCRKPLWRKLVAYFFVDCHFFEKLRKQREESEGVRKGSGKMKKILQVSLRLKVTKPDLEKAFLRVT
ncbi:MAG: hypothetical protein JSV64_01005 [Candidatus Bathyarchaeota archaeon]|nr:MAG: hypothetical protein JSV64_01005 [Candidatus Bathyarchaeota archaeon]